MAYLPKKLWLTAHEVGELAKKEGQLSIPIILPYRIFDKDGAFYGIFWKCEIDSAKGCSPPVKNRFFPVVDGDSLPSKEKGVFIEQIKEGEAVGIYGKAYRLCFDQKKKGHYLEKIL